MYSDRFKYGSGSYTIARVPFKAKLKEYLNICNGGITIESLGLYYYSVSVSAGLQAIVLAVNGQDLNTHR